MITKITHDQIQPGDKTKPYAEGANEGAPPIRGVRLLLGDSQSYNQRKVPDPLRAGGSWLQSFSFKGSPFTGWAYLEVHAGAVATNRLPIGATFAARTSNGSLAIGSASVALQDAISLDGAGRKVAAWGKYIDVVRTVANSGDAMGIELNVTQAVEPSPSNKTWTEAMFKGRTPYKPYAEGEVIGIRSMTGSDSSLDWGRTYATDAHLHIGHNGSASWTGVNFYEGSLMREGTPDDKTLPLRSQGYARAISLPENYGLSWYAPTALSVSAPDLIAGRYYIITSLGNTNWNSLGLSGTAAVGKGFWATGAAPSGSTGTANNTGSQPEVARITSRVVDRNVRMEMAFTDTAITFSDRVTPQWTTFNINYNPAVVNGISVNGSVQGEAVSIRPHGFDTNINLILSGKGTGTVVLGTVQEYADNAAAAAAGVPLSGIYHTAGTMKVRTS